MWTTDSTLREAIYVKQPIQKLIAQTKKLIDRLLLERISLAELTRSSRVSAMAANYVNDQYTGGIALNSGDLQAMFSYILSLAYTRI